VEVMSEVIIVPAVMLEKKDKGVFPQTYGGIVVNNELEYCMLDDLSIRMLKWLRDMGNPIAARLVQDMNELEDKKVQATKEYVKTLNEKAGNPEKLTISESLKKRVEVIKQKIHVIPEFEPEPEEDNEEVTHSLFESMGDMFEHGEDPI